MKYTANHKLKLPEPADTLDIEVLDENFINIDALIAALQSGKADKNSPSLTGTPTAPTAIKFRRTFPQKICVCL